MLKEDRRLELEIFAAKIRLEIFKELVAFGFGHVGGAMSCADILSVLYGETMNIDPSNPDWEDRDYFTLSKGHAGPAVYATLALKGYFPMEKLATLNQNGTILPSHCSRVNTPGVDLTAGSLGTGFSAAIGAAAGQRVMGRNAYSYCIVGDGEMNEGQIWEGILFAAQFKLDNFILFVDANKYQLDGKTDDICALGDLAAKFREFNWFTQRVDGHDVSAVYDAVMRAKEQKGQPSVIVADTIKGKGCKLAEDALAAGQFNHAMVFSDAKANEQEILRLEKVIEELEKKRG